MPRFLKVSEDSLTPAYRDGDFVLISKVPILLGGPKPGDAVVFRHAVYGTLIKLVQWADRGRDEIFVVGLAENSVDSRRFGPIRFQDVQGVVIWRVAAANRSIPHRKPLIRKDNKRYYR